MVALILRTRDTTAAALEEESWNVTLPTGKPAIFTSKSVEPQADITVGVTLKTGSLCCAAKVCAAEGITAHISINKSGRSRMPERGLILLKFMA